MRFTTVCHNGEETELEAVSCDDYEGGQTVHSVVTSWYRGHVALLELALYLCAGHDFEWGCRNKRLQIGVHVLGLFSVAIFPFRLCWFLAPSWACRSRNELQVCSWTKNSRTFQRCVCRRDGWVKILMECIAEHGECKREHQSKGPFLARRSLVFDMLTDGPNTVALTDFWEHSFS